MASTRITFTCSNEAVYKHLLLYSNVIAHPSASGGELRVATSPTTLEYEWPSALSSTDVTALTNMANTMAKAAGGTVTVTRDRLAPATGNCAVCGRASSYSGGGKFYCGYHG